MQSLEIRGLDEVIHALDATPDAIRNARAEVMAEMGQELLSSVQQRIGGTGRVAGVQEYRVGSGKGYVAVRPMSDTELDGYAAGYITNSLEGGHAIRKGNGLSSRSKHSRTERGVLAFVPGKYMYRETRETEAERLAESGAQRIEAAAVKALNGGTT